MSLKLNVIPGGGRDIEQERCYQEGILEGMKRIRVMIGERIRLIGKANHPLSGPGSAYRQAECQAIQNEIGSLEGKLKS